MLAGPVGPVGVALGAGPVFTLLTITPFIAAVVLIGAWLRREPPETVPPVATPAE